MNTVNTMNWLNSMSGNFATYMKNYTTNPFYGVTVNGTLFVLHPESNMLGMGSVMPNSSCGGIQIMCFDVENGIINTLQNKWYKAPVSKYPAYIEEMNCVLFNSFQEREERIKSFGGSVSKMMKAYASGMAAIINASYTAITALNVDEHYYTMSNGQIVRLPSASDDQRDEYLKKYNIDPATLDVSHVFIVNNVIRNLRVNEGDTDEVTVSSDIKIINKNQVVKGEPLIQDTSGLVVFNNKENADLFIEKFGTITKYLVSKAVAATKDQYELDLEDMNDQASKDKQALVNTFMLMGGTALVSTGLESCIKAAQESDNNPTIVKKTLMVCGIVGGTVVVGIGMYKMIKNLKKFNIKNKIDKNE